MAKVDTSSYDSFDKISERLDEIVSLVKDKNVSLERSLDLFDEALALGSKAIDVVDTAELSAQEQASASNSNAAAQEEPAAPAAQDVLAKA